MRLGVSPAASTPLGVFNQRFEAFFPDTGALGCMVCFAPLPFFPVYLCANVGPRGLLAVALPAPFVPQSATSLHPPATAFPQVLSARMAVSTPPTGLDERFFFISLVVGLHAVRFSVSSGCLLFLNCCLSFGCVRRCSVSTYASFFARTPQFSFLFLKSICSLMKV